MFQRLYPNTENIVHSNLVIGEKVVSPQIVSGNIFINDLNYGINIIRASAFPPNAEIISVGIKIINTRKVHSNPWQDF